MNWLQQNPIPSAILAVALLGTGATGYLAFDASTRLQQAVDERQAQLGKIQSLDSKKPFPNEPNLKAVQDSVDAYRSALRSYRASLIALEAPAAPANPQEFQDELRNAVNALQKTASEKNVQLPDGFFYGFEPFKDTPPSQQETPALNREFQVIRSLVDPLVQMPVVSIDGVKRAEPKPTPAAAQPPGPPKPAASPTPPPLNASTFTLSFTGPQEKVINAFNAIQTNPALLLIRSVTLENSSPTPPPRATPQSQSSVFESAGLETEKIQAVLGRESVKAVVEVELLDFADLPEDPKK
jgi:hypothetical protein